MKEPLDGFADRLIRNGEVPEFLRGLIEKGYPFLKLFEDWKKERRKYEDTQNQAYPDRPTQGYKQARRFYDNR